MRHSLSFVCALFSFCLHAYAVDLNDLNVKALTGKTVTYFFGSFDPFHNDHLAIVTECLKHSDYVLVYTLQGEDSRKPNRSLQQYRQEMLSELFKDSPQVITTHLNGCDLQRVLRPYWDDIKFIGVIGEDVLNEIKNHKTLDAIFLRGKALSPEDGKASRAAMMVVPASEFFVFVRGDTGDIPKKLYADRAIQSLSIEQEGISSTVIRKLSYKGKSFEHLVPKAVSQVIRKYKLYRRPPEEVS